MPMRDDQVRRDVCTFPRRQPGAAPAAAGLVVVVDDGVEKDALRCQVRESVDRTDGAGVLLGRLVLGLRMKRSME